MPVMPSRCLVNHTRSFVCLAARGRVYSPPASGRGPSSVTQTASTLLRSCRPSATRRLRLCASLLVPGQVGAESAPGFTRCFSRPGLDILRLRNRYQRITKPRRQHRAGRGNSAKGDAALGHRPKICSRCPAAIESQRQGRLQGERDCTLAKRKTVSSMRNSLTSGAIHSYTTPRSASSRLVSIENEPSFIPHPGRVQIRGERNQRLSGYDKALAAVHAKLAACPIHPSCLAEVLGIHNGLLQKYVKA